MASKVNTKFVAIVAAAVIAAGGIIGFLYMLNVKGDATRVYKIGEEALAAGDFKKARDYFGRAVYKDPGNPTYLEQLEVATRQLTPTTADEAVILYTRDLLGIYRHAARHRAADPTTHLRMLDELLSAARITGSQSWWQAITPEAEYMWQQLPADNPQRNLARVYQALPTFRLLQTATLPQLQQALTDLEAALPSLGDHDLAWSTLIVGQVAILERMRTEGRTETVLQEQRAKLEEARVRALEAAPNGPETARMNMYCMLLGTTTTPPTTTAEQVATEAKRLVSLLEKTDNGGLVSESWPLLNVVPGEGPALAEQVVKNYSQRHPNELDKRLILARLMYFRDSLDEAQAQAAELMAVPLLPASLSSQLQFALRQQAAGLIVDVEGRRFEMADAAGRPAQLRKVEAARDRLSQLVTDPSTDLLLLKADGKIAFIKNDFSKAAANFEKLVREGGGQDIEVLLLSAASLERVGQVGLAHERYTRAVEANPNAGNWVFAKAKLEYQMGRFGDASTTLARAPAHVRELKDVKTLMQAISEKTGVAADAMAAAPNQAGSANAALTQAGAALSRGDADTARALLEGVLERDGDDLAALLTLIQIEMNAGQTQKAAEHLARAQAVAPDDASVKRMALLVKNEDPIAALKEYVSTNVADEADRAVALLVNLSIMESQQRTYALRVQRTNPQAAAKATELADRAKAELGGHADQAIRLAPDRPQVIEYQFKKAANDKDWAALDQVVSRTRDLNLDQADGMFYRGRADLAKGRFADAVRSLEIATDRIGYSSAAWRALGFAYQGLGNSAQAQRAYEQAYKCNPNDLDAVREYVAVLLRRGEKIRALRVLQTMHALVPTDAGVRDTWLQLESEVGNRALSLKMRREVYRKEPSDRQNAVRLARFLGMTPPSRELIIDDKGEPTMTETRWTRMNGDERAGELRKAREAWLAECNAILDKLVSGVTDEAEELQLVVLRAALLRERGDVNGGESILNKYIAEKADKATAAMHIELARYQAESLHFTEAIATLEGALPKQNPELREVDMELGNLHQRLNSWEKAVTHLQAAAEATGDRGVQNQVTECLIKLGRFDEAEQRLRDVVAEGGEDYIVTMLHASVAEGRGDALLAAGKAEEAERQYSAQRDALGKAESQEPGSHTPRLLLAQSLLKEYRRSKRATLLDDALDQLERADRIRADATETSMIRVMLLREKGDRNGAINELRRVLERNPSNNAARRDMVALYMENRQSEMAIAAVDDAIRQNPTVAVWHEAKADLLRTMPGDNRAAVAELYATAHELSPTPVTILKAADANFALDRPDCAKVAAMLEANAAFMEESPAHREIYARALACSNRRDQALEEAGKAYRHRRQLITAGRGKITDIAPWYAVLRDLFQPSQAAEAEQYLMELCGQTPDLFDLRALAAAWQATGSGNSRAIELQRRAIAMCPEEEAGVMMDLYMNLANFLLLGRNLEQAAAAYEQVIKIAPDHVPALNNLAYLLAQEMGQPAKAVPHAKHAAELAPESGSVLDTYGWVLYLNDDLDEALATLQSSVRLERSATTYLHLANVHVKRNEFGPARKALDDAAKYNPDPETRQKIDELADDIDKRGGAAG